MIIAFLYRIFTNQMFGSLLLFIATIAALLMANSEASILYNSVINFSIKIDNFTHSHLTVLNIINDGLMTIFFLSVGLEIKYELIKGALNSRARAAFPVIAGLGGMVIPVIIYSIITSKIPILRAGWAIPAATDIAFAIGVLTLLGKRVPISLKIFLLALAIIDDLGAIIIVAVFYNTVFEPVALIASSIVIGIMILLNYFNIRFVFLYLLLGVLLWVCFLFSDIHTTLAGVITGGTIPLTLPYSNISPACTLDHRLKSWVIYLILPLFAFSNAGISLNNITLEYMISPLTLGIAIGLVLGKPLGIILFTLISIKLRIAKLPSGVTFPQIAATSTLCGIGFTMSIFIANLAFGNSDNLETIILAKAGILTGSLAAAILGYFLLRTNLPKLN